MEALVTSRVASASPFFWGFTTLVIDAAALASGKIGIERCAGAFPDGLPFACPGDVAAVRPVDVSRDAIGSVVRLCAPSRSAGPIAAEGSGAETRYVIRDGSCGDLLDAASPEEPMKFGEPNLFLHVGDMDEDGFEVLKVARIKDVATDRSITLDSEFAPTVVSFDAADAISGPLTEIANLMQGKARALAGRQAEGLGFGDTASEPFMLLQLCNRWWGQLSQTVGAGRAHPVDVHRDLFAAAAEFATFTREEERLPIPLPPYDHDALTETFHPLFEELRRSLGHITQERAVALNLEFSQRTRIYFVRHVPEDLVDMARFILAVRAAVPEEELSRTFQRQVSIASVNEIPEVIRAAERSVPIKPLADPPTAIRKMAGWVYFELDRSEAAWDSIARDHSVAIHPQNIFDQLEMSLWAVRN